ncbi:MAG: DNA methyltransferase [Planctomycetota bacterium]
MTAQHPHVEELRHALAWHERLAREAARSLPAASEESVAARAATWLRSLLVTRLLEKRGVDPAVAHDLVARDASACPPPPESLQHEFSREHGTLQQGSVDAGFLGDLHETLAGIRWRRGGLSASPVSRKRHGVFFTPATIVDLMVERSLRLFPDLKTWPPERFFSLRLVDPACGSGAFLVAAYRRLLVLYGRALRRHAAADDSRDTVRNAHGELVPSASARRRLLESCIYGIDIDAQAVETTACRLALTLLDAEQGAASVKGLKLNLRVGDALLGSEPSKARSSFSWEEAFPAVFRGARPGFDWILCNPPYRFGENIDSQRKAALEAAYACASPTQWDTWSLFLELALRRLASANGAYAFIVPDALLARRLATPVREFLLSEGRPCEAWHVGAVFNGPHAQAQGGLSLTRKTAGVSAVVIVGRRGSQEADLRCAASETTEGHRLLPYRRILTDPWKRFLIHLEEPSGWERLEALQAASDPLECHLVEPGIGRGEERGKKALPAAPDGEHPIAALGGGEVIRPFHIGTARRYLSSLTTCRLHHYAPGAKLLAVKTGSRLVVARAPEDRPLAFLQTVYALHVKPDELDYLEGWLNTDLLNWVIRVTITAYKRLMPQLTQDEIRTLPVPRVTCSVKNEVGRLVGEARRAPFTRAAAIAREIEALIAKSAGLGRRCVTPRERASPGSAP